MSHAMDTTRRQFVKSTVAACAAPTIISGLAAGQIAANDRITIALIGCGGMGNSNLRHFLRLPDTHCVAVCDVDAQRAASTRDAVNEYYAGQTRSGSYAGCDLYSDFRDVLARPDVDAVIQAAPDHWHAYINTAAARAGKDIYGEKPLTRTVEEGRLLSDCIERYGRIFQTGSQQRSDSRFRYACELVRNGRIGTVRTIEIGIPGGKATTNHPPIPVPDYFDYDMWLGPAPWAPYCENRTHYNFRYIFDYSGGKICDWGAHHIDIAQWGLGMLESGPVRIEGVGEFPRDGLWDTAVNYRFTATYDDGVVMNVDNAFPQGVKFIGEDGWVFVRRGHIDANPKSLLTSVISPSEIHLHPSGDHRQNFLDCVRSRRQPAAPVEHAHRTISIAHLANIAMQLEAPINWDPGRERIVGNEQANRMLSRSPRGPWRL
jgi:predicted dehydrogenase